TATRRSSRSRRGPPGSSSRSSPPNSDSARSAHDLKQARTQSRLRFRTRNAPAEAAPNLRTSGRGRLGEPRAHGARGRGRLGGGWAIGRGDPTIGGGQVGARPEATGGGDGG